jgi:hypothetical protein
MPSTLALAPVMAAVIAKLVADTTLTATLSVSKTFGGPGIYNAVPQGEIRPYLVVDGGTEVPFNTLGLATAAKWGSTTTLQVKHVGDLQSDWPGWVALSRVKTILDGQPLTVPGFASVIVEWDSVQPSFTETVGSTLVRHVPGIVRVSVHES